MAWWPHTSGAQHERKPGVGGGWELLDRVTYGLGSVFPFFAAERLARQALERVRRRPDEGPADVVSVPHVAPSVERLLMALTRFDERLLASRDLPFGSSVFVAATKLSSQPLA